MQTIINNGEIVQKANVSWIPNFLNESYISPLFGAAALRTGKFLAGDHYIKKLMFMESKHNITQVQSTCKSKYQRKSKYTQTVELNTTGIAKKYCSCLKGLV